MFKLSKLFIASISLVTLVLACSRPPGNFTAVRLSTGLEPLRTDFNGDAGRIRLVLLVDPT